MKLTYIGFLFHLLEDEDDETYWQRLSDEEKRRRDKRIPRAALKPFPESPWWYMYMSGNDQALLNMTGCDHVAFTRLLELFSPYWYAFVMDKQGNIIPRKRNLKHGRPRMLNDVGGLGLVLTWYRTKGSRSRSLAMNFGLTSTPMANWLWFGICCLRSVLVKNAKSQICPPSDEDIAIYKEAICSRYPSLPNVWCAVDGCKLKVTNSQDWYEQIANYNGWHHCHYVNSVFTFAPDGKIRICVLNCPGSWHDSPMADFGVYQQLEEVYDRTGGQAVVDSAFKVRTGWDGKEIFIKSSQEDPSGAENIIIHRDATSIRQLSEWGMRMVQAQCPRITDVLPKEDWRRQAILHLAVLIYNFTTSEVGINQILNTYMYDGEGVHLGRRINYWNNIGDDD